MGTCYLKSHFFCFQHFFLHLIGTKVFLFGNLHTAQPRIGVRLHTSSRSDDIVVG